jgi:hypothetical protein
LGGRHLRFFRPSAWQVSGGTGGRDGCPDIWELSNGDIVVIGRDVTAAYEDRLPADVMVASDERIVVIPRNMLIAAKPDIPDA